MKKTYSQKIGEVERSWHLVDVDGRTLGRVASEIAQLLTGKRKPTYTPNIDAGDFVVVVNAAKVAVTGTKETDKVYYRHTNHPGGIKEQTLSELRQRFPERIIKKAVYNMLPKNRLRQHRMTRLKIYAGAEHKHESQLGGSTH